MPRIAVLISGFGSNLQAIIDAVAEGRLPGVAIAVVVSNRRDAYGLERARRAGIPTEYHPLKPYRDTGRTRQEYDADLAALLKRYNVEWVVLAGWMHVLSNAFLQHFPNRVINLHPALPGMFPGTGAIRRAFEAYQRGEIDHTGVMVHLVPDEAVDAGPVILQETVPIYPDDTLETLEERIHQVEHRLLVEAIRKTVLEHSQSQEEG
ncbi:MAG: phosphoribosylglycinamide formyltransferase [Anaerolineae bacterium]|nr:phosphoribosylglycinamide formyltransferase [Anaerolineae bacterium]MDW8067392.1 phosphoribosylglycinamide formyltransferase [Anaerolineae bacterium]